MGFVTCPRPDRLWWDSPISGHGISVQRHRVVVFKIPRISDGLPITLLSTQGGCSFKQRTTANATIQVPKPYPCPERHFIGSCCARAR